MKAKMKMEGMKAMKAMMIDAVTTEEPDAIDVMRTLTPPGPEELKTDAVNNCLPNLAPHDTPQ